MTIAVLDNDCDPDFSFPTAGAWSVTAVMRSVGSHVTYQVRSSLVNVVVGSP